MSYPQDLVRYLTLRLVRYMDNPQKEREKKVIKKKENWSVKWFGVVPMSIKMIVSNKGKDKSV